MPEATWEPNEKHGRLTTDSDLPAGIYAFPKQRKEPLTDAEHVRNAVARFDQVIDVSDEDRDLAFANIQKAALHKAALHKAALHKAALHDGVSLSEGSCRATGGREEKRHRTRCDVNCGGMK